MAEGDVSLFRAREEKKVKLNAAGRIWTRRGVAIVLWGYLASLAAAASTPQETLLWPKGAPGSEGKTGEETVRINEYGEHIISNVNRPSITPFLPAKGKSTGAAVVILPGGGHSELWMDHEGYNVAKWLSERGVAGFVVKYRLSRAKGSAYTIEGDELPDVKRAIRLVRSRASEWGLDAGRIGVMGFSAGGELAALASTRYDNGDAGAADPIERESSKPAFQALLYPEIPQDMKLSAETPTAFLACGELDRPDISQGLPELYLALKRAGVSAELHVYANVGHGFGVRESNRPPISDWPQLFLDWMGVKGFLKHE
jgi:acetyl esterase/lipase